MNHRIVFYYVCLITFFSSTHHDVKAFDTTVTNSITDIVARQKIQLRIRLDATEQGIFHDTLRFSVDTPSISLNGWRTSVQPISNHLSGKYARPLYAESFFATLAISVPKSSLPKLASASICVASFVLTKEGKICAKTVTTPLGNESQKDAIETTSTVLSNMQTTTDNKPYQSSTPSPLPTHKLLKEFSVVDGLSTLWYSLIGICLGILRWRFLWIVHLGLLMLYILFHFKLRNNGLQHLLPFSPRWDMELRRGCAWLIAGITLYHIQDWFSAAWGWFIATAFMLAATCYYSTGVHKPRTFLEKLKLLVGFVCGLLVIPLLIKGLLVLHKNNIFEIFGK